MKTAESEKLTQNYFQFPNTIVEDLLADMSGAELKCYLVVVRLTRGWQKSEDAISISQFQKYTGLSNRAVIDACDLLIQRRLLTRKTGARGVSIYALYSCKKFTSEESSHVNKDHGKCEESSQVTSEESSHTKESSKNTPKKTNYSPDFETFWSAYPRHVNKQVAYREWQKLKVTDALLDTILKAIERNKKAGNWNEEKFIVYPERWLKNRRWEDEITPDSSTSKPFNNRAKTNGSSNRTTFPHTNFDEIHDKAPKPKEGKF